MSLVELLPYKKLSPTKTNAHLRIFRVAGKLIKKHSLVAFGNKKGRHFRRLLFTNKLKFESCGLVMPEIKEDGKVLQERKLVLSGLPKADYEKMMKAHGYEEIMLYAYARAITKIASHWHRTTGDFTSAEDVDYFQTACVAFVDALYGYAGKVKSAKFETFMWRVLRNRMITFVAKHGPFGSISVESHLLIGKIENIQATSDTVLTPDELAAQLNVSVDEIKIVQAAMVSVMSESQLNLQSDANEDQHKRDCDYTAEGRAITIGQSTFRDSNRQNQDTQFDPDMKQAVENCPLTPFERDVLITSAQSYHGWQTEVASRHINPKTSKNYSRMAPAKQLPTIHAKVRAYYEQLSRKAS